MMKKNWFVFPAILLILAGLVFASVFSCKSNDDGGPTQEIYKGSDTTGKEYELKINSGKYELLINGESVSTGNASKSGDTITLTPNSGGDNFTVTVSGSKITGISGAITPDDGSDPVTPGTIISGESTKGAWDWALSDDSGTNEYLDVQTIFAPGGASRFDNAVDDPTETDQHGSPVKRPYVYPAGTVTDSDGNPINEPVYNFKGTTKVTSDNRTKDVGARFPLLGWEATPNPETLEKLRTAYSYSFYVRLNSSMYGTTSGKWAFVTTVFTDFPAEKGYEYGHWFGNTPGDSGSKNRTSSLVVGEWYKITVILSPVNEGGNIDQAQWIHQYNKEFEGPFKKDKIEKLQWQIPLQHNGGTARGGDPYDIIRGSYTFDLDFYGLTLNME